MVRVSDDWKVVVTIVYQIYRKAYFSLIVRADQPEN